MDLVADLQPIALAAMRLTLFLVVAPPFSHGAISGQVKAMLGVWLAFLLGPHVAAVGVEDTGEFVLALVSEGIVGAALGFVVRLAVEAITAAGRFIDLTGGFEMASAFDPMTMIQGGPFGRFYSLTAVVLLFVSDAYQLMIRGLARSFDALPLGVGLDLGVMADEAAMRFGDIFLGGLMIAGPLMAVLFLVDIGFGLLSRAAPALNAFALGFPLKVFTTLVLGGTLLAALPGALQWVTQNIVDGMAGVIA